jgi:putative endopeptidase
MIKRKTRKVKRSHMENRLTCSIVAQAPVLNFSSKKSKTLEDETFTQGKRDFYTYVNESWIKKATIPLHDSDFGVSEEVEECINKRSKELLTEIKNDKDSKDPVRIFLRTLAESCLHSASQPRSIDFLKDMIKKISCVETPQDILKRFTELSSYKLQSILQIGYTIDRDEKVQLCIEGNLSSLPTSWYFRRDKLKEYRELLKTLGKELGVEHLEKCLETEKDLVIKLEETYRETPTRTTGNGLVKKFPGIDWELFFTGHGIKSWKTHIFYYRSPQWLRKLGRFLKEIPVEIWRLLLARAYIFSALRYLPPPFDEYDNRFFSFGQRIKMPQNELFLSVVYDYCNDIFSKLFWDKYGDESLVNEIQDFTETLIQGANKSIDNVEWMCEKTKEKAKEKINAMRKELVRPKKWATYEVFELDSKNLLKNIYLLGAKLNEQMIERVGREYTFWEEGLYRVNAYYFNENNEIMIPFGTIVEPFYKRTKSDNTIAWNYGALGSIIGHEMCHAFDEDGKEYNSKGEKKNWWYRRDKVAYSKKTKELIQIYNKEEIVGKNINGKKTLSENIADLGGVGIALHALKEYLEKKNIVDEEEKKRYYREFFIAYAISWRTKYKDKKLEERIEIDRHSPAPTRVNVVVRQFKEWYEAFGIEEPDTYIRIF